MRFFQSVNFQRALQRVNQPGVADMFASIDSHLSHSVDPSCRRRNHFAHPIWSKLEVRDVSENRQPFSLPASEIRNENIWTQVQFWFKKNPPPSRSTWASKTAGERAEVLDKRRRGVGMGRGRPRRSNKLSVN